MRAKTIEMVQWIREHKDCGYNIRGIFAEHFNCDPNNFNNISRRYRKYIDDPTLPLDLNQSKKQTNKQTKQTILTQTFFSYKELQRLIALAVKLESKRLVKKSERDFLFDIILKLNDVVK